ncbi:hypothetical protein QQF64_013515 [Cirrhinus molitorella]|uniref:Uncharacterized protein n=1 Tax=Cirrhinus molitorella TaxID=172907 RepID=A0ABR3LRE2_9TELE
MQKSGEISGGPSTRPKRQRRPPQYLEDYELGPVRQRTRVSPHTSSLPYMQEERGGALILSPVESTRTSRSSRQVQWDADVSEHIEEYLPSYDLHSGGLQAEWTDTPTPYAEDRNERYGVYRKDTTLRRSMVKMQSSPAQLGSVEREISSLAASVKTSQRATQEPWPVAPPPIQDDFQAQRGEDEYDDSLPPPPWPSNEPMSVPLVCEESQMVTIIERMMNQLQLMRDSAVSSSATKSRLSSTPQRPPARELLDTPPQWSRYYSPVASGPSGTDWAESEPSFKRLPTNMGQRSSFRHLAPQPSSAAVLEKEYRGPTPKIPLFIHRDPMEFSRLKLALTNLLPRDATELFKYQVLVDHLRLEEACLVADSHINSHRPYSDTMAALNEKFGQPHHIALKRIAAVLDSPEIKRGDAAAFERFALHVQS